MDQLMKTEVSLTLASRIEIKDDDDSDIKNILLRSENSIFLSHQNPPRSVWVASN